ncbi:MAG: metallophosphoesterase-domain-containing protein, partial [Synergistaceae bacterium]|nr:metallophosphoesterase-domain-containing protein [Synergistaceae bacterium]
MKEKVRIHLVTDIHYGPDVAVKKGESALWLLDGFVRRTNEIKPDLAVDLGDRIS